MAENNRDNQNNKQNFRVNNPNPVTQFSGGLVTDTSLSNQPNNSLRFCLNGISETLNGDLDFTSNERGNSSKFNIEEGYNIVGHLNFIDNEYLLFLAKNDNPSIIALIDKSNNYKELIKSSCLNFKEEVHIKAKYRLINGCERVVYFVDGNNTDKAINIDNLISYVQDANLGNTPLQANIDDTWECGLFNLEQDYKHPIIELDRVIPTGGNLEYGTYRFGIQYSDSNQNLSNVTHISNAIPIIEANSDYIYREGADPTLEERSNSSIRLNISNLDTRFGYINIVVIQTKDNISTAYKLETLSLQNDTLNYTFREIGSNAEALSLNDVVTNKVTYESSETLEIFDNRLFRANLKEKDIKWSKFQQAALNIQTTYFTQPTTWSKEFVVYSGAKDEKVYYDKLSYMRDEIYALGIIWVFKDGTESPVFHIPGRRLNKKADGTPMPSIGDPNIHNRQPASTGWDDTIHTNVGINNKDDKFLTDQDPNKDYYRWQVYNTALREYIRPGGTSELYTLSNEDENGEVYTSGQLAYWESEDFTYPTIKDCEGNYIYPVEEINGKIVGQKIRHHKMPDTTLEEHFDYFQQEGYKDFFTLQLGLKFENITPPSEYLNQIQGYYIVRGKRSLENKTILDKGLIYHNIKYHYPYNNNVSKQDIDIKINNQDGLFGDVTIQAKPYSFHTQTCLGNQHWFSASSDDPNITFYGKVVGVIDGRWIPWNFSESDNGENAEQYFDVYNTSFHSPKTKFETYSLGGSYYKIERLLEGSYEGFRKILQIGNNSNYKRHSHFFINYHNSSVLKLNNNTVKPFCSNYLINTQSYVQPHFINSQSNTYNFVNRQQQETYVITTHTDNPVPHFDNIQNTITEPATSETPLVGNSVCLYSSIKQYNPSVYGNLYNIEYQIASKNINTSNSIQTFGGDCFISRFGFIRNFTNRIGTFDKRNNETLWKQVIYYFVESEINTELRHEFRDSDIEDLNDYFPCTTYYPKESNMFYFPQNILYDWDGLRWTGTLLKDLIDSTLNDIIEQYIQNNYCKNYYAYNNDYSVDNAIKYYFPLPINYKYCSDCSEIFPHRIVYSQKGFDNESIDNYRVFLANSSGNIEGTTGVITDLWKYNDNLYIHTEEGLWVQQIKPYQLQTNTNENIYVGIGDTLETPPKGIKQIPTGYAGNKFKQALALTEVGAFFPDESSGKIFRLGQNLDEISRIGEKNWFENNLPINFLDQFYSLTNSEYPFKGTSSNLSIGFQSVFDNRHDRWILIKKDYKLLIDKLQFSNEGFTEELVINTEENDLVFIYNDDDGLNGFYIRNNDIYDPDGQELFEYFDKTDFDNKELFENLSWTKSFDTLNNVWKSYHSYLPNYIYNTQEKWFSYKIEFSDVWEHNNGEFGVFYNNKYPFIIETIKTLNQLSTFTLSSVDYLSNSLNYNDTLKEWKEVKFDTFNNIIFYNSNQSTGIIDLVTKNTNDPFISVVNILPNQVLVNNREKTWSINNFRNNVINENEPLFTKNWNDIQSDYFIDKLSNQSVIDYSKSLFEKDKFRDKYLACRFQYNNNDNNKLIFKFLIDNQKVSYT